MLARQCLQVTPEHNRLLFARTHNRACRVQKGQHDDLAGLPCTRSRQGHHRGSTATRNRSHSTYRPSPGVVQAARDAWPSRAISGAVEPSLRSDRSLLPGNGILPPETKRMQKISEVRSDVCRDRSIAHNSANSRRFDERQENLSSRRTVWWAREMSHVWLDQILTQGAGRNGRFEA